MADASVRTQRLLHDLQRAAAFAGDDYPLGANESHRRGGWSCIGATGRRSRTARSPIYDALMPMSYFTWHHPTADGTHRYIEQNIQIIRREVGSDQVPIHVIERVPSGREPGASRCVRARAARTWRDRRQLLHVHRCRRRGVDGPAASPRTPWSRRRCRSRSAIRCWATSPGPTPRTGRGSSTRSVGSAATGCSRTTRSTRRRAESATSP